MEFDWRRAIERNSEALCTIAARLIVMAGIEAGRTLETLPRHLYLRILALLRPAEFAARRLIAMAACKLDLKMRARSATPGLGEPPGNAIATLPAFALFDPFKRCGHPWLEPDEIAAHHADDPRTAQPPGEPVDVKNLSRRIRALADALSDMEGQALRLARWRARRAAGSGRPTRWSPFRPGRPPGWTKRPKTEIEEVLKECHFLARDAWDTS